MSTVISVRPSAPVCLTAAEQPGAALSGLYAASPGMSAYELAVAKGFSGTVEQWLESLVGRQGEPGIQGEPGVYVGPADSTPPEDARVWVVTDGQAERLCGITDAWFDGENRLHLQFTDGEQLVSIPMKGDPGTTDYRQLEHLPLIPQNTSQLYNDSGFVEEKDLSSVPMYSEAGDRYTIADLKRKTEESRAQQPIASGWIRNFWNTKQTYTSSNSTAYTGFFHFRVRPIDCTKPFCIRFCGTATMPNWTVSNIEALGLKPSDLGGGGDGKLQGFGRFTLDLTFMPTDNKTLVNQIVDCDVWSSSYRPLYYCNYAYPKAVDKNCWWYFGWSIYSAYMAYTTSSQALFDKYRQIFGRDILTDILEMTNCEMEWLEEPIMYAAANLPEHTISNISVAAIGRTQTGDVNQIDRNTTAVYKVLQTPMVGYQLMMHTDTPTGMAQISTLTASSTAQTKVLADVKFHIWAGLYYYASSTVKTVGSALAGLGLYNNYSSLDLRYSTNCGSNFLKNAAGYDVYLRGTMDDDGLFSVVQKEQTISGKKYNIEVIDSTMLAFEENGYTYILLGHTIGTNRYSCTFPMKHPVYRRSNGKMIYLGTI